jgi:UDPglucose 6-dehydrogenase
LIKTAQDHGVSLQIVEATASANEQRKRAMARKLVAVLDGSIRGKTIALLGLTFKPNTDDMREAPSIALITALKDFGAEIRAYDPAGMEQAKAILPDVTYCDGPYSAATGAHALVVVTEWEQFRALDLNRLKSVMKSPIVIDLKNIYQPEHLTSAGFVYDSIGRPTAIDR